MMPQSQNYKIKKCTQDTKNSAGLKKLYKKLVKLYLFHQVGTIRFGTW